MPLQAIPKNMQKKLLEYVFMYGPFWQWALGLMYSLALFICNMYTLNNGCSIFSFPTETLKNQFLMQFNGSTTTTKPFSPKQVGVG
jgi:membrane protein insertase Oxa1/YidC/SpoIIIJ